MRKTVQVIAVKCYYSKSANSHVSTGERLYDERCENLDIARTVGNTLRKEGVCVIIRQMHNEKDSKGNFFREWRSFDGGDFTECKWQF